MSAKFLPPVIIATAVGLTAPALAQSSLGLGAIEATAGVVVIDGQTEAEARIGADFAITGAHGLELDLSVLSYPGGTLGQIDAHLYLAPDSRQKFGLFLSLGDVGGREATIGMAGAEFHLGLGADTILSAQGGIGMARSSDGPAETEIDFAAASAGVTRRLSDSLALTADLHAARFQEEALDATAWGAEIGVEWQVQGSPFTLYATAGIDGLSGDDGAATETVIRLGGTWRFGDDDGSAAGKSFESPRPFDPLLRRSLF